MNQTNLLEILKNNHLMQTEEQVTKFENALTEIYDYPDNNYLCEYHLLLDDQCEQPEVMFGLIHFLESFEMEQQLAAFIKVVPQLMIVAPEWTRIIHNRVLNDQLACQVYQKILHSMNLKTPHFIYHLLEESTINQLKNQDNSLIIQ